MKILSLSLDDLTPHPKNVRQGDVGAIAESLTAHGQYRPIVVQKETRLILAGNHTWKAAKVLGWKKIDVVEIDVDDEQAARILLVDNRSTDLATYDDHALAALLESLSSTEIGLDGTGFDGDDLDDLLFQLNRSAGNMEEGYSKEERTDAFEKAGIRSVILPYPDREFDEVNNLAKKARQKLGYDTNSDLVLHLLRTLADSDSE
jgi:ParB-like chromosome segregation protein Spo0J